MIMSTTADFHVGRPRQRVLALHCSGADHRQWRKLRTALEPEFELIAPDFYGCEATGPWHGARRFSLAEEAAAIIELIDDLNEPVHLVGHSYGGGVALKVAIERPGSIRSLTLYEPSAFHILRQLGEEGAAEFAEIRALADDVGMNILRGAYQAAARSFVDYWNGHGAWDELRAEVRTALLRWLPKAPLDFAALIEEPTPISAYRVLCAPYFSCAGNMHRALAEKLSMSWSAWCRADVRKSSRRLDTWDRLPMAKRLPRRSRVTYVALRSEQ